MDAAERGEPDVAGGLGLGDPELERRGARLVVAGLALRAAEARELVGLGLQEAEPAGRLGGPADVRDGVVEAVLDARELAEHRVAADVQPRVVDDARASARTSSRACAARDDVAGRDRGARGEERVRGLVPGAVEPVVQLPRAVGERQRLLPLAAGGRRRRRGSRRSGPRRSGSPAASSVAAATWRRAGSRWPDDASIQAASSSAVARSRAGAASPAASSAASRRCAPRLSPSTIHAQPNPLAIASPRTRVVRRAPGQRGVDVRALGAREREVLGLAARCARRPSTRRPAAAYHAACASKPRCVSPASASASSANARMLSSSR